MKTKILLAVFSLFAAAACSSNKVDHGDPDKCLAGEVLIGGECVPAGCSQDIHCDDGNPCNGLENCINGRCALGGTIVESCDDGIHCTQDFCDKVLAECIHVVRDERCEEWEQCDPQEDCIGRTCSGDQICSDGLYCNGDEKCSEGQCLAGRRDCDDQISCTLDTCSEGADKCQHVPQHEACPQDHICSPEQGCIELPCETDEYCDDGSYCNGEESCLNGKCVGGLAVLCNDRNDCTTDACDEAEEKCVNTPNDSLCDDGLYCNGPETCSAEFGCVPGITPECRDAVGCTDDSCDPVRDVCQYVPNDANCASTEICSSTQDCQPRPECSTDSDCPAGMECQNHKCIGTVEEPQPMDGDDGGMQDEDGGYGDDGYGDDGYGDYGYGDDGYGDDGYGDDGGMGDDGGDGECEHGQIRQCNTGQPGVCAAGTDYCDHGVWTGCVQATTAQPEKCDGLDNDCDGNPDDEGVCGCLEGCEDDPNCDQSGVNTMCEHIPNIMTACIGRCAGNEYCEPSTNGDPKVCVDTIDFAMGPLCMCEPTGCPQNCQIDRDCWPYGLAFCDVDLKCSSYCAENFNCPAPYKCEQAMGGKCTCNPANIGISCLECDRDTDCYLANCSYRDTDPVTDKLFKECQYGCGKAEECPQAQYGDKLYCHWGQGNTPNRCACEPEQVCAPCIQIDPDPCQIAWMSCNTFTNAWGTEIVACTTPCMSDDLCPAGWICWEDGLIAHGWCIEQECHCTDTECGPGGIDPVECPEMFPGFECLSDESVELCTKYCDSHMDCPIGYWCDTDGGTGTPICRCAARAGP